MCSYVDESKHRAGEHRATRRTPKQISIDELLEAAKKVMGLERKEFCCNSKTSRAVAMREAVIVLGREAGYGTGGNERLSKRRETKAPRR